MRSSQWLFAALVLTAPAVRAAAVAVGAFAGAGLPIQQDDTATGPQFGVRLPIAVLPYLTLEPCYAATLGGDIQERIQGWDYTRSGFDVHAFGVNVAFTRLQLAPWLAFDPYAGIGPRRLSRTGTEAKTHVGYDIGLGFGFAATEQFTIQVRGELEIIDVGDTSRKFANLTAGAAYRLR